MLTLFFIILNTFSIMSEYIVPMLKWVQFCVTISKIPYKKLSRFRLFNCRYYFNITQKDHIYHNIFSNSSKNIIVSRTKYGNPIFFYEVNVHNTNSNCIILISHQTSFIKTNCINNLPYYKTSFEHKWKQTAR